MPRLACADYGFECDFVADGETEQVLVSFGKHTIDEMVWNTPKKL